MSDPLAGERRLFTGSAIEVYTGTLSARAGDEVTIHVSTTAARYDLTVSRIGAEQTVVWRREGLAGEFHPTPERAWEGCGWPVAVTIAIPEDWRSGYYEIVAETADAGVPAERYEAFVVVRATTPTAPTLLVLSTNTYAAYNFYGDGSLYYGHDDSPHPETSVSTLRPWIPGWLSKPDDYDIHEESLLSSINAADPLQRNVSSGVPWLSCAAGFANWERVIVGWLEREGYEVDLAVNADLQLHPELLSGYRLLLSVGHDEYWSWEMRDTVESFVAEGGNVCFLSGNTSCWQVRLEDDGATVICYRARYEQDPGFDPAQPGRATTNWFNAVIDRPESRMTGVCYYYAGFSRFHTVAPRGPRGFLVYRPEHWIFDDTAVGYGDCIGTDGIVLRYELDGCPIRLENGLPYAADFHDAPSSLEILGMAPAALEPNDFPGLTYAQQAARRGPADPRVIEYIGTGRGHATMAIYTTVGTVFTAGTTDWTNGLKGGDPEIEQITRNLIDRLSAPA
jgi:hypothetical protein